LDLEAGDITAVLSAIKQREYEGYHYEAADASLALLIGRTTGDAKSLFELETFRIISEKRAGGETMTEATIKLLVKGQRVISTAEGNGPVNALDRALRQAIGPHYPELKEIHLSNYKVRIALPPPRPAFSSTPQTASASGVPSASERTSSRPRGRLWWTASNTGLAERRRRRKQTSLHAR
jgi:hypothetical protein